MAASILKNFPEFLKKITNGDCNLSQQFIQDKDIKHVVECLNNKPNITSLNLSHNVITTDAVCNLVKLQHIKKLNLCATYITEEDLQRLSETNISHIVVDDCDLEVEKIEPIVQKMKSQNKIVSYGNNRAPLFKSPSSDVKNNKVEESIVVNPANILIASM